MTECISSQIGCKYNCLFCKRGKKGFTRNLSVGEILNQVLFVKKKMEANPYDIVFMGIGEPLDNYDNVIKAIRILKSRGVKEVIVKLGKEGAGYEDKGKLVAFPATPVGRRIDTTGAGDCFIAGFLYGMIQQRDISQAIKIANLTASYSIQKKGAAISFPNKSEIDWKKLE